jgi:hypothetical protein
LECARKFSFEGAGTPGQPWLAYGIESLGKSRESFHFDPDTAIEKARIIHSRQIADNSCSSQSGLRIAVSEILDSMPLGDGQSTKSRHFHEIEYHSERHGPRERNNHGRKGQRAHCDARHRQGGGNQNIEARGR